MPDPRWRRGAPSRGLVVAPLAAYLPLASVAAILFLIAYGLIDVKCMKSIVRTSRSESAVMFVTLGAALFLGLQTAIYAGVLLSLMLFLNQAARPGIRDVKPDFRGGACTDAIAAIYPELDPEICRRCTARIFPQCQPSLPDCEPRSD